MFFPVYHLQHLGPLHVKSLKDSPAAAFDRRGGDDDGAIWRRERGQFFCIQQGKMRLQRIGRVGFCQMAEEAGRGYVVWWLSLARQP